ncbi:uncharacterized protein C17orf80 homolog isoform X1 [Seriola dumerili]|uniref:uncharacterized protein C17orf80 homolog isoform X1 n=1 Tax=Seriola dumerili TaxID=41447 RepID=UPI000BBF178A|nr:uncharacterized protein C17orf80 homolog isoform X1 [Seriola dumerili]
MSSEVCPFCGKTYKRLKSHLPHCKAAAKSKTPPTERHVRRDQTTSPSQLVAGSSEPMAEGTLSTAASPQSKERTKVSAVSSPAAPFKSENTSSLSQPLSPSPTPLPPSTKKKKQKLSEQIKMATTTSSLISSPALSLSPSPTISKPKKKSLLALIEAAKSDQVTKGSLERSRSAAGGLPSGSDALKSRTTAQTETSIIPDNASFAPPSTDTKPKDVSKKKVSKTKRAVQSLSTTKDTDSHSLDSEINESGTRSQGRDNVWVDNKEEMEDLSMSKMFLKSGSGHQAKIIIQDVKATLGRAKSTTQSSKGRIPSQAETTDNLSSKTRLDTSLSPVMAPAEKQKDVVNCLVTTKTLSDQFPSVTSPHLELQSVQKKSQKSKQTSLIPLQHDGSSQPRPTFPAPPVLSGHLSSQSTPLPRTVGMNEGLKVGHPMTELLSISPSPIQLPSHLTRAPPARVEAARAAHGLKLEDRKQNTAHSRTEGAVSPRSLGQVRLRELPEWLACKTPSHPRDVVEMVQRGWHWYYRRYIDVRKGGVGGLGMLVAGYCVLSYIWSYPHIKRDRWRKYH